MQDLLPDEIRLLLRITRTDTRTGSQSLLLFYDNAQNIYGSPTPVWQDLGVNIVGRTEFLDTCLRNTRQTIDFAFNVLVGSHAAEGQRVSTRQFADVSSLRQRGLVAEKSGRFETSFAPRTGPVPRVTVYTDRRAEISGVAGTIRQLTHREKVLPSDILVLYNSHLPYREALPAELTEAIGPGFQLHLVDRNHERNKDLPLLEEGQITASTIASAKGYDAPVVIMLGADSLEPEDVQDRATFYVGATRAKLLLYVSGVRQSLPTLLDEIVESARALDPDSVTLPSAPAVKLPEDRSRSDRVCRHCGGRRLHAQHGRFGYYYICIDCMENTPMDHTCPVCGKRARIRKSALDFLRDCEHSKSSTLIHKNVPLAMIPVSRKEP